MSFKLPFDVGSRVAEATINRRLEEPDPVRKAIHRVHEEALGYYRHNLPGFIGEPAKNILDRLLAIGHAHYQ
jgi:hypothetical protein